MDADELISKLLRTGSLSVGERKSLKNMGKIPIARKELALHISEILDSDGWFPPNARPWKEGEACFEGHFIEKNSAGKLTLHWQRHHPLDPYSLAQKFARPCRSINEGLDHFCKWDWSKGIDGIPIVP